MNNVSLVNPFLEYAEDVSPAPDFPTKPPHFTRVTDTTTYTKFHRKDGFQTNTSTRRLPLRYRITPRSVKSHLEWTTNPEWGGLISFCGTERKAQREIEWRQRNGRRDITAYTVSTEGLSWREVEWDPWTKLNVLADEGMDVMVFKATELIQKMGLQEGLKDKVKLGAMDEWLALEWIPSEMVVKREVFS